MVRSLTFAEPSLAPLSAMPLSLASCSVRDIGRSRTTPTPPFEFIDLLLKPLSAEGAEDFV